MNKDFLEEQIAINCSLGCDRKNDGSGFGSGQLVLENRFRREIDVIVKVLFAIKSMNSLGGGAERVLSEVVNGIAERGHQVLL